MKRRCIRAVAFLLALYPALALAQVTVRVATYNIENFSAADTSQLNAAVAVLSRVGADIVCVQEIDETSDLAALAGGASYPYHVLASGANSFDSSHHAGILSKYPFTLATTETSITLSGDSSARDISRNFIVVEVDVPGAASDVVIIGSHWKSGTDDSDEFRRSVESIRAMQVAQRYDSATVPYFIVGDMNDDINDNPDSPSTFSSVPSGAPVSFNLGNDIDLPISNGIFYPLLAGSGDQELFAVNAYQLAGFPADATRISGRRLDYLWRSQAMSIVGAEVYDSADEGVSGGLPKYGSPLPAGTSALASDHLMVFADITVADDSTGACCTICGCVDDVTAAECGAENGTFRGVLSRCDELSPECPPPSNDFIINEVQVTHAGSDETQEFVEIMGAPGAPLCGLTLLAIEGETLSKGRVDLMVPLDDCGGDVCTIDSNGFFVAGGSGVDADLVIDDGSAVLENGTQTIVLVRDTQVSFAAPNNDVDADNDGVADMDPGILGLVISAVGLVDGGFGSTDVVYFGATPIGPDGSSVAPGGARCPNGIDTGSITDWVRLDFDPAGGNGCLAATPGASNGPCGGDGNEDDKIDLVDFAGFQACFGLATPACSVYELDGECGITIADFELFHDRITGP